MARKQMKIPGTEAETIKELNEAAEAYVEIRDKRMGMSKKEHESKQALVDQMRKHKREVYRDDDMNPPLVVTLLPGKDGVKVAEADPQEGAEAEVEGT